jgi:crotonobetainyl-CoA:carnitine CoA-transferase CaiB-like acyl-CoA transferase
MGPQAASVPFASTAPLAGIRVLDFGQYVAGPLLATLLADQGAEVVRVEHPDGPRMRSGANATLLRGRRTERLDLRTAAGAEGARELASAADVLVENFRPGVAGRLGIGWNDCRTLNPSLVHCSLPGFATSDPRAGMAGWETVVLAAAGAYAKPPPNPLLGSGSWPRDRPMWSPLPVASIFAAAIGAVAVVAALVRRQKDGRGRRIEVALFGAALEAMGARLVAYERRPVGGRGLGSGVYRCRDDRWVSFIATRFEHLQRFAQAAGIESALGKTLDFDALEDRAVGRALAERLIAIFGERSAAEWEEAGTDAQLPLARIRTPTEWSAEPQARTALLSGDGDERTLAPAVTVGAVEGTEPAGPVVEAPPGEELLAGLRVLDLTRVMAGPTATRVLAELGALVVKADVDPATRKLGYREPLFHEHMNRGKLSVEMDLKTDRGRELLALLSSRCDILVVNVGLDALERLGLRHDEMMKANPGLSFVYLNAFGDTGPWSRRLGFAETVNVSTGLTSRTFAETSASGGAPQLDVPRSPFTDYLAGIFGAFGAVVATFARDRTGFGRYVHTSLQAAACYLQLPHLYDPQGGTDDDRNLADCLGWSPLHRLFETRDGWIAVGGRESARASADDLEDEIAALETTAAIVRLPEAGLDATRVIDFGEVMADRGPADLAGLRDRQISPDFGEVVQPGCPIEVDGRLVSTGKLPSPFGADGDVVSAMFRSGSRQ